MTDEPFERDYGCTEVEWLRWMPEAVHGHAMRMARERLRVSLGAGELELHWQVLEPRRIALLRMPRLRVVFCYRNVEDDVRREFQRRFDLYLQRGGG